MMADFLILTLAGCGVAFELPVVLAILGAMGMISARGLWRFSKYALILSAVAGAVLTPSTDPFTQILLAGPLYMLYNISILFVWLIERARRKRDAEIECQPGRLTDRVPSRRAGLHPRPADRSTELTRRVRCR